MTPLFPPRARWRKKREEGWVERTLPSSLKKETMASSSESTTTTAMRLDMVGHTHASRRQSAAEAAQASDLVPINSKKHRGLGSAGGGPGPSTSKSKSGKANAGSSKSLPVPRRAPPPVRVNEDGKAEVLQGRATIDTDEQYGEQEKALSEFLRLHPMLSLESTSHRTLQLMADLVGESAIPTRELEAVPKSHDDLMLRAPETSLGERPCSLGERCICVWMARWRYGEDTDMAFVGTEFLLPSQKAQFLHNGKLPSPPGKCLVCSRYFHTYIYKLARTDPTFCANASVPLQAYGNVLGTEKGESIPTHSSVVHGSDGYSPEAMLFVDESWADSTAARGPMGTLLWRPVVGFSAKHYKYVRDPQTKLPRLLQVGIGSNDPTIEKLERQLEHDQSADFQMPVSHPTTTARLA